MSFSRESSPVRNKVLTFRVTEEEKAILEALAKPLGARGVSEVIRVALDYFIAHSPQAGAGRRSSRG